MSVSSSSSSCVLLIIYSLLVLVLPYNNLGLAVSQVERSVPLKAGLSWNFHRSTCPRLESMVRNQLKKELRQDIGLAAGFLRLHFHDCFVQGCDGSVLLEGSASGPGEQDTPPNFTLRPKAFKILNEIRAKVHRACGRTVSCSDLLALAARDSVALSGGPDFQVPLGRKDSLFFATREVTLANLPPPSANTERLLRELGAKNFDPTDVVALSGAHTIGLGPCASFTDRLYPTQDPTMDKTFANNLKRACPAPRTNNSVNLDLRTPNIFDNKYYVDLMNRQGLFTSDQDLFRDKRTRPIVESFAVNQNLFYERFKIAMTKMGQLHVLTGGQGEIRANCSIRNVDRRSYLASVVGDKVIEAEDDGFLEEF